MRSGAAALLAALTACGPPCDHAVCFSGPDAPFEGFTPVWSARDTDPETGAITYRWGDSPDADTFVDEGQCALQVDAVEGLSGSDGVLQLLCGLPADGASGGPTRFVGWAQLAEQDPPYGSLDFEDGEAEFAATAVQRTGTGGTSGVPAAWFQVDGLLVLP